MRMCTPQTVQSDSRAYSTGNIDDGHFAFLVRGLILLTSLLRDKAPQTVDIDDRAVVWVVLPVEVAHTYFTEVTRVAIVALLTRVQTNTVTVVSAYNLSNRVR